MPDVFTKRKRSEVMARIRSRGNRDTELALAKLLRAHGITGWRRQVQIKLEGSRVEGVKGGGARSSSSLQRFNASTKLTVRPDFVFLRQRLAIFVDGCFWHACPKHATKPKQNAAFWRKKLAANTARDRRVNRALRRAGWRVLRIWEHELKRGAGSGERGRKRVLTRISRILANGLRPG